MKISAIDYVIFIVAVVVFFYCFFIIGMTPLTTNSTEIYMPRQIKITPNLTDDEQITTYVTPTAVIICPLIALLELLVIIHGEQIPRLRDIPYKKLIQKRTKWLKEEHTRQWIEYRQLKAERKQRKKR